MPCVLFFCPSRTIHADPKQDLHLPISELQTIRLSKIICHNPKSRKTVPKRLTTARTLYIYTMFENYKVTRYLSIIDKTYNITHYGSGTVQSTLQY